MENSGRSVPRIVDIVNVIDVAYWPGADDDMDQQRPPLLNKIKMGGL